MTNKAPAYQWFPKDYDTDEAVQLMTYEQEGIYRRLLDHQHLHGSIPSDPQDVAKLLPKISVDHFLTLWPRLEPKFPPVNLRRVNPKLERVKAAFTDFLAGKSRAGTKSAQLRLGLYGTAQPLTPSVSASPVGPAPRPTRAPPVCPVLEHPEQTPEQLFEALFRTAVEPASALASASPYVLEQQDSGTSGTNSALDRLLPQFLETHERPKSRAELWGSRVCPHEPRCLTCRACIDRTITDGRIARERTSG